MIKKLVVIIFATFTFLTPFAHSALAQTKVSDNFGSVYGALQNSEYISSFDSIITVNKNNSVDVIEKITYKTALNAYKHGIYRDIYPYSSEGRKMVISNINVSGDGVRNANSGSYSWQLLSSESPRGGKNVRIKIGDPNTTFTGERVYVISYTLSQAVAHPKDGDLDEIYWNFTGNDWLMPIKNVNVTVNLPDGVLAKQTACYVGLYGAKNSIKDDVGGGVRKLNNNCSTGIDSANAPPNVSKLYSFSATDLAIGEGLTVAIGFSKGLIPDYTKLDNFLAIVQSYWQWIFAIIIPLASLLFFYRRWSLYGRDPKGTGVIIPQYDVPDKLAPLEVAGLVYEKIDQSKISAELIYLATKGYIKIRQIDGPKVLGMSIGEDYELIKLKDWKGSIQDVDFGGKKFSNSDLSDFDIQILNGVFKNGLNESVTLSSLKNVFYKSVPFILISTAESLKVKGYYKNLGNMAKAKLSPVLVPIAIIYIFAFNIVSNIKLTHSLDVFILPVLLGSIIGVVIYLIFSKFMASKTEKGVSTYEYLLGLKEYLQIAEKDRLTFHNAPEKKPEVFEKLLPYAMILGVEKSWAKEFEGMYTQQPGWYEGSFHGHAFSAMAFSNSLSDFNSYANTAMITAPQSNNGFGSGGGGFSGGGGGGGGGGSW